MNKKKLSMLTGLVMAGVMALAGCGGSDEKSGTETQTVQEGQGTQEKAAIKMITQIYDGEYSPEEVLLYQELEEKTGVKIEWECYRETEWPEKKSLLIANQDLPDALFGNYILSDDEVVKYGSEGVLIPLEDYISEENTPNIWKVFQDYPNFKSAVTAPDGHIYSLPAFDLYSKFSIGYPLYINKDWLENVGMEVPTTTEELRNVLRAFKEQDANGNGDPNDEIPYSFQGSSYASELFGAFGMPDNSKHITVKDGKVVCTATQESYKEAIKYFNSLFDEGLIDQEAFTQDGSVFNAKLKNETRTVGVFQAWRSSGWALSDDDDSYVPVGPLEGPNGDKWWPKYSAELLSLGAFSITNVAEDPAYIMNWVDNCFDPLFALQAGNSLKVGVHLQETGDGTYEIAVEGNAENRLKVVPGTAERITCITDESAALISGEPKGMLKEKQWLDTFYEGCFWEENYPVFLFSAEDSEKIASYQTEIKSFIDEKYATWMMNGGIDDEWDAYLKQLDDMGLQKLLDIYQENLDRYNSNL